MSNSSSFQSSDPATLSSWTISAATSRPLCAASFAGPVQGYGICHLTLPTLIRSSRPSPRSSQSGAPAGALPETVLQYWAPIEVQVSDQPIVYIEYASATAAFAQTIAQKLKAQGFRIPGVELSDLAKGIEEIHFYFANDKPAAEKLAAALAASLKELQWAGARVKAP